MLILVRLFIGLVYFGLGCIFFFSFWKRCLMESMGAVFVFGITCSRVYEAGGISSWHLRLGYSTYLDIGWGMLGGWALCLLWALETSRKGKHEVHQWGYRFWISLGGEEYGGCTWEVWVGCLLWGLNISLGGGNLVVWAALLFCHGFGYFSCSRLYICLL
jgi:hypothetical protein